MKKENIRSAFLLLITSGQSSASISQNQITDAIGLFVALLVLAYVFYSLLKPEKF